MKFEGFFSIFKGDEEMLLPRFPSKLYPAPLSHPSFLLSFRAFVSSWNRYPVSLVELRYGALSMDYRSVRYDG